MTSLSAPMIGPVYDGNKQNIALTRQDGIRRTYVSTPEKIDEFMKTVAAKDKKGDKNAILSLVSGCGIGACVGTLVRVAKVPLAERLVFGGAIGALIGFITTIGIAISDNHKNEKLIDKFFNTEAKQTTNS